MALRLLAIAMPIAFGIMPRADRSLSRTHISLGVQHLIHLQKLQRKSHLMWKLQILRLMVSIISVAEVKTTLTLS